MSLQESPAKTKRRKNFWRNFITTLGTTPIEKAQIIGASGFEHPIIAAGIDAQRNRLVIISADNSPRLIAMAHSDIQAAVHPLQVVTAHPIRINIKKPALEKTDLSSTKEKSDKISDNLTRTSELIEPVNIMSVLQKGWLAFQTGLYQILLTQSDTEQAKQAFEELKPELEAQDFESIDQKLGICPIPLYEFSPQEIELICSDTAKTEEITILLHRLNIIQYFFPAPDQLALGIIARTSPTKQQLNEILTTPPKLGHPYGHTEILDKEVSITTVLDALQERNYIVSGKLIYETTPQGEAIRKEVCFTAKESLVSKIINRFKISIDIKKIVSLMAKGLNCVILPSFNPGFKPVLHTTDPW